MAETKITDIITKIQAITNAIPEQLKTDINSLDLSNLTSDRTLNFITTINEHIARLDENSHPYILRSTMINAFIMLKAKLAEHAMSIILRLSLNQ